MKNFQNLLEVLYRKETDSIPKALHTYIAELRQTADFKDQLHANTLEYYLKCFEKKEIFDELRNSFNEIYMLIENEFSEIRFRIDGRRKSLISTDKKILNNLSSNFTLDTIKDFLGVRILVIGNDGKTDPQTLVSCCYDIVTLIINHLTKKRYQPLEPKSINNCSYTKGKIYIPEEQLLSPDHQIYVKDYIRYPKENGYQSLHVAFRFPDSNDMFELQIRTFDMHLFAASGEASHDSYKKNLYGETVIDRSKINIPGYAVDPNGTIEDLIGLEESFPMIMRAKSF